jgi:hypothetical protein
VGATGDDSAVEICGKNTVEDIMLRKFSKVPTYHFHLFPYNHFVITMFKV